jgi:hypothetical protein
MATLLRADGTSEEVEPANGKYWTLAEMQKLVGGYVEPASAIDGRVLLLNEHGKIHDLPPNEAATRLFRYGAYDRIVGDVLVVTHQELKRAKG